MKHSILDVWLSSEYASKLYTSTASFQMVQLRISNSHIPIMLNFWSLFKISFIKLNFAALLGLNFQTFNKAIFTQKRPQTFMHYTSNKRQIASYLNNKNQLPFCQILKWELVWSWPIYDLHLLLWWWQEHLLWHYVDNWLARHNLDLTHNLLASWYILLDLCMQRPVHKSNITE